MNALKCKLSTSMWYTVFPEKPLHRFLTCLEGKSHRAPSASTPGVGQSWPMHPLFSWHNWFTTVMAGPSLCMVPQRISRQDLWANERNFHDFLVESKAEACKRSDGLWLTGNDGACMHAKSLQSCLTVTSWTVARQVPLSMGFSRQEHWNGWPFPSPGDLTHPGIEPASLTSPALAGGFFTTSATWKV